jgi:hypothetical protein
LALEIDRFLFRAFHRLNAEIPGREQQDDDESEAGDEDERDVTVDPPGRRDHHD